MLQCDWIAVTCFILTSYKDGFVSSQDILILNSAIVHNFFVCVFIYLLLRRALVSDNFDTPFNQSTVPLVFLKNIYFIYYF